MDKHNQYTPRCRVMQHTQALLWCREQQATSLKITEGNPARDPSQNEMGRSVFKTTTIQATGCSLRVSKEPENTVRLQALRDTIRKKISTHKI